MKDSDVRGIDLILKELDDLIAEKEEDRRFINYEISFLKTWRGRISHMQLDLQLQAQKQAKEELPY